MTNQCKQHTAQSKYIVITLYCVKNWYNPDVLVHTIYIHKRQLNLSPLFDIQYFRICMYSLNTNSFNVMNVILHYLLIYFTTNIHGLFGELVSILQQSPFSKLTPNSSIIIVLFNQRNKSFIWSNHNEIIKSKEK